MHQSDIEIPEPCSEDWDSMTPNERGRYCDSCRKTVHDLSGMTEADARRVLEEDDVCVTFEVNERGLVLFEPAPIVPLSRLTRKLPAVAAAGLSLALAACAPHAEGPSLEGTDDERPVLLEYTPAIPDAEPCDSIAPPDHTPPTVQPHVKPDPTVDRRLPRKQGKRVRPMGGKPVPIKGKRKSIEL